MGGRECETGRGLGLGLGLSSLLMLEVVETDRMDKDDVIFCESCWSPLWFCGKSFDVEMAYGVIW